jgi:hypothetical protein
MTSSTSRRARTQQQVRRALWGERLMRPVFFLGPNGGKVRKVRKHYSGYYPHAFLTFLTFL